MTNKPSDSVSSLARPNALMPAAPKPAAGELLSQTAGSSSTAPTPAAELAISPMVSNARALAISGSDDYDAILVAEIKSRLAAGTFNVDFQETARKMLMDSLAFVNEKVVNPKTVNPKISDGS